MSRSREDRPSAASSLRAQILGLCLGKNTHHQPKPPPRAWSTCGKGVQGKVEPVPSAHPQTQTEKQATLFFLSRRRGLLRKPSEVEDGDGGFRLLLRAEHSSHRATHQAS